MLIHLRVQNIALIDEVAVDLSEGLNVLTGETGAGKSIILGAINLALGGRGSKDLLRDASKPATVDLLFTEEKTTVLDKLEEMASLAGDAQLLPREGIPLVHRDGRTGFRRRDGSHHAGRAASDHGNVPYFVYLCHFFKLSCVSALVYTLYSFQTFSSRSSVSVISAFFFLPM